MLRVRGLFDVLTAWTSEMSIAGSVYGYSAMQLAFPICPMCRTRKKVTILFCSVLLFSAPLEGENQIQNSKTLAEYQARKNAINVASSVIRAATDLLHRAQGTAGRFNTSQTERWTVSIHPLSAVISELDTLTLTASEYNLVKLKPDFDCHLLL